MNSKGIMIALGVLAALVLATLWAYRTPPNENTTLRDPWHHLDQSRVDRLVIQRPSAPEAERTIEFEKSGGAWRMVRPGQGPTEPHAVEDLLERFERMHVASIAGRSAQSYSTFEVDDAHAVRVTLHHGSSTLLDAFVGIAIDTGTAVRVPGHTEIYRVNESIHSMVGRSPRDWRDRDVTHAERDRVRSVEWVNARAGGTLHFDKNGDTWTLGGGRTVERLDTARVSGLADTVANLRATDFAEAGAVAGISDTSPAVRITVGGGDAGPTTMVVRLGASHGDNEAYAQREGSPIVFVVSRTMADAINPELSAFQTPLPPPDAGADAATDASAAPAPAAAPTPPPGGGPTPSANSIPPEVMEQIRRQLQQQGGPH